MCGYFKLVLGFTGMVLASVLSLLASGEVVSGAPYNVTVNVPLEGRAYDILGLDVSRIYTNITVILLNGMSSELIVRVDSDTLKVDPGGFARINVLRVDSRISLESANGVSGNVDLVVYTMWREGVNPALSIIALILFLLSMMLASLGLVEVILSRRY